MDRKTLEYMEERTRKAREIVGRIDGLLDEAKRVSQVGDIQFRDIYGNNLFALNSNRDGKNNRSRLIKSIRPALEKLIADEITLLEQELAEL